MDQLMGAGEMDDELMERRFWPQGKISKLLLLFLLWYLPNLEVRIQFPVNSNHFSVSISLSKCLRY